MSQSSDTSPHGTRARTVFPRGQEHTLLGKVRPPRPPLSLHQIPRATPVCTCPVVHSVAPNAPRCPPAINGLFFCIPALLHNLGESLFFFFFFPFLGLQLQRTEVPSLGVKSELLPKAHTTATAMPDLNRICGLHGSLRQRQIFNHRVRPGTEPPSSRTLCRVLNPLSHKGNSLFCLFKLPFFPGGREPAQKEGLSPASCPPPHAHSCCFCCPAHS